MSAPAAVNSPDGRLLDVFAQGADGRLYELVYERGGIGWGSWQLVPGQMVIASAPAVVNSPDGTLLSVFVLGQDQDIYQIVYARGAGGWRDWQPVTQSTAQCN